MDYQQAIEKAADLAGRYRVRSVIPQLEAVAVQRGETSPRESAIRALGQIGGIVPRARGAGCGCSDGCF